MCIIEMNPRVSRSSALASKVGCMCLQQLSFFYEMALASLEVSCMCVLAQR
jgi:carbamoylphosphate synthase large subunit